ncbi:MAG: ketopantoate reductase family protein [Thermomicrobia bacterium]|nr:ketopantoate reductase family protein [Thermomicrobia bacterium]MCA1723665.1 ketopantoate reductase family protein [Thermomicrobia bacterium]
MQITVIGAGAMGSLFGALLQRAGNAVTLVDVRSEHVAALRKRDLTIEEPDGSRIAVRVPATTDAGAALAADLFVLLVKTPFTAAALKPFAGRIPARAMVLTLQNGIGNDEAITRALGRRVQITLGVTAQAATSLGPTTVRHRSSGPTIIGLPDGQRPAELEAVVATFSDAGIPTRMTRHIFEHVWQKLLVNVGINALTALANLPNGGLFTDPEMATLVRRLVGEAANVMRAEGIPAPPRDPVDFVRAVAEATKTDHSSMLEDLLAGRRTEIDAINGAIVRLGERHGIDVTANRVVTTLVHQRAKSAKN